MSNETLATTEDKWHQAVDELEAMKEQLTMSQDQNDHLTIAVAELQDKIDETCLLLKEAKDENAVFKERTFHQNSSSMGDSTQIEHESIVDEIEEALRKEIIAASTLPERPQSPNHYAKQRTMVVMETVRAATLASQQRKERLTARIAQPVATSSPRAEANKKPSFVCPPSPVQSSETSISLPEELIRYKNQTYVAPEKLQIVKPLEGSVTLLKWKLLASPQLGGATSFFSETAQPGVHRKKWKAGGQIVGSKLAGSKMKSLSTADISSLQQYPQNVPSSVPVQVGLSASMDATSKTDDSGVLKQVGSYIGSGLSRFGFGGGKRSANHVSSREETNHDGLSSLLD